MTELYHATQLPLFTFSQVCTHCRIDKPVEDFFKNGKRQSGYQACCKDCMYMKYSPIKNPSRRVGKNFVPPLTKICIICHVEKPINDFHRKSERQDGRESQCKECRSNYTRQRRLNDPEWAKEQDTRPRVSTPKRREGCKRRYALYMLDPVFVQHKQEYNRLWRKEHPEKLCEKTRRRAARIVQATIGDVDYKRILERSELWCYICEKPILPQDVSYDHVIPLARGGDHSEDNIKITHKICNYRKGYKLLSELSPHQRRGI